MHIASVGIDLGKTTFHLVALDERGQVVIRKKLADAMAAKTIIQTKKGDAKIKGQFQVVKPTAAPAAAPDAPAA